MERVDVIVVGGGQAGLATSHELGERGIEHVVLERGRIGQSWRDRWDSFCLVTPNWGVQLPGRPYDGDDPDGYLPRDEIVGYLEGYATAAAGPIREGVEVTAIRDTADGFELDTSSGALAARELVLATGAYQRGYRPPGVEGLPAELAVLDLADYTNEAAIPPGRVLVIGSGQSGCQLAEELHEAGREVFLACGRAPWVPRRLGGRDIFWWILEIGFMAMSLSALPDPVGGRLESNPLATGHGGGHDLHLRTLRAMGVTLLGHFEGAGAGIARFSQDLDDIVAWGDQRHMQLMGMIAKTADERGIALDDLEPPPPFDPSSPAELDLAGFGAVVLTGGFRPDYRSWLPWSDAFDDVGFPIQQDGASTVVPGLSFVGVHFMRTRKSSLLIGVGEDSAVVADGIASRMRP
jgi:putative flavoprotein involved in K+ transport